MRSRVVVVLLLVLALVLPAQAVDQQYVYKNTALGTTSTVVAFTISAQQALIQNRNAAGGVSIYIDFAGGTADSDDFELIAAASISVPGETLSQGGVAGFNRISLVSASATSNVQVLALR